MPQVCPLSRFHGCDVACLKVKAEKIFDEADLLAEQKVKSRFPELHPSEPTATPHLINVYAR